MSPALALSEALHFQSPSGNIQCVISGTAGGVARCDLGVEVQSYTDRPDSCDGDWGISFGVMEQGPGFLNCVTDAIGAQTEVPILPYGGTLEMLGIACRSEPTGMTCENAEGGGFFVRRAEQRVF